MEQWDHLREGMLFLEPRFLSGVLKSSLREELRCGWEDGQDDLIFSCWGGKFRLKAVSPGSNLFAWVHKWVCGGGLGLVLPRPGTCVVQALGVLRFP